MTVDPVASGPEPAPLSPLPDSALQRVQTPTSGEEDLQPLGLSAAALANCRKLPPLAFAFIACRTEGERIVALRRGVTGFFNTRLDRPGLSVEDAVKLVALYNRRLDVSERQKEALVCGSMRGFEVPGADPDFVPKARRAG